ncbi:ABC transporter substrate-binding protein [Paenibacillus sp. MBLB4367]|uniref:ABC transporter substrate-binding protein n=1 Tax=Paenibacillus sp. MBLB4367 TaxID=3384767 RepID=UPI003907FF08
MSHIYKSKFRIASGFLLASAMVVSGCSGGADGGKTGFKPLGKDEKAALKVAFFDEQAFDAMYGNVFRAKYPGIEVEVVSTREASTGQDPVQAMKKLIDEQKPDVTVLSQEQYASLSAEGLLYDLEPVVKQDKFDIENVSPSVVDALRTLGGGKLNGLAPSFDTQAVYYNKDLFAKYGIPLPADKMSWEQFLQLAQRFPADGQGDDRIYGLFQDEQVTNPFDLASMMGASKGLTYVNPDTGAVTIDTKEWKQVVQAVADSYKSKKVFQPEGPSQDNNGKMAIRIGPDTFKAHKFLGGKAAMMLQNTMTKDMFDISAKMGGDTKPFEWGVVTIPVDPSNPDVTSRFSMNQIYAVTAQAANVSAAWELVKFINGAGDGKSSGGMMIGGGTSSRLTGSKTKDGKSLEAFYTLKPNPALLTQKYPQGFASAFNTITAAEMKAVLGGSKTVDDALKAMQTQGQEAYDKAKLAEQKASSDGK